nr:hypothetical protein [Tanacetum cinerariifolium]
MMTCHPLIRPAATCTVPRTQLLAASRRNVAASYWIAASDVAATSAPVNAAGHRSTAAVHGGDRRSMTVNVVGHRSTPADHGGDRRSTTVAGGEPSLTGAGPPLTTTGPPVSGGWWAGQRLGLGRVRVRSGSGLGWVRSATWHATCAHVAADVDIKHYEGVEPCTTWKDT